MTAQPVSFLQKQTFIFRSCKRKSTKLCLGKTNVKSPWSEWCRNELRIEIYAYQKKPMRRYSRVTKFWYIFQGNTNRESEQCSIPSFTFNLILMFLHSMDNLSELRLCETAARCSRSTRSYGSQKKRSWMSTLQSETTSTQKWNCIALQATQHHHSDIIQSSWLRRPSNSIIICTYKLWILFLCHYT
jgi:hypothetical protein